MIQYQTIINQFNEQGEKTGWSYIDVPADIAEQLCSGRKTSFRVKGKIDHLLIKQVSLLPMGEGNFIIPLKADIRKALRKERGATVSLEFELDESVLEIDADLIACLEEEPVAFEKFNKMPRSHQHYYSKWILTAKTEATKAKRIAMTLNAMLRGMDYGEMIRAERDNRL
ncbi:DUF1905 domain-containing protein [Pedobacter sp. HMF7647]|uniref:DUF1905 domain-containing protein n=1 Tax=Hufsiella arboris TaxID=2695275 RepID=A0A7K1Y634_9SPHI|nr:YdeI/OmpD-associated family protein [Hufsiella arboris]MXV50037.1 DUF1905 domain-containing protein [Hufsiella arboris]